MIRSDGLPVLPAQIIVLLPVAHGDRRLGLEDRGEAADVAEVGPDVRHEADVDALGEEGGADEVGVVPDGGRPVDGVFAGAGPDGHFEVDDEEDAAGFEEAFDVPQPGREVSALLVWVTRVRGDPFR